MTRTNCKHCGREFQVYPSDIKLGRGLFCGRPCTDAHKTRPVEERFWEKVNKTESCWLWTGATCNGGYGYFAIMKPKKHCVVAHRFAWELVIGPITEEGIEVCHNCPTGDNPLCVRPDHMFLGTQKDNLVDAVDKGRMDSGENSYQAKLTNDQVRAIRAEYALGNRTQRSFAIQYGVCFQTMNNLLRGRIWRRV